MLKVEPRVTATHAQALHSMSSLALGADLTLISPPHTAASPEQTRLAAAAEAAAAAAAAAALLAQPLLLPLTPNRPHPLLRGGIHRAHRPVELLAPSGTHWNAAEKARFADAVAQYGPFAWAELTAAVRTRSTKQVKAFSARHRHSHRKAAGGGSGSDRGLACGGAAACAPPPPIAAAMVGTAAAAVTVAAAAAAATAAAVTPVAVACAASQPCTANKLCEELARLLDDGERASLERPLGASGVVHELRRLVESNGQAECAYAFEFSEADLF